MRMLKNAKFNLGMLLTGLVMVGFQNCGRQTVDFKSSLPENSVFVASSISNPNQLLCPDGSAPLLDSTNPCPAPVTSQPPVMPPPVVSPPVTSQPPVMPPPVVSPPVASQPPVMPPPVVLPPVASQPPVSLPPVAYKENEKEENEDYKDKIECVVGHNFRIALKSNLEESHSNSSESRLCMSEQACLNLVNAYATRRNCELKSGHETSNSSGDCTHIFQGSKGTCKNAHIAKDDEVKEILEKMRNER